MKENFCGQILEKIRKKNDSKFEWGKSQKWRNNRKIGEIERRN